MAWTRVTDYALGYSILRKEFYFYYRLDGDTRAHQIIPSPQEFTALADMFRNEGPINFNTIGSYFVSAAEQIGEEEANPGT